MFMPVHAVPLIGSAKHAIISDRLTEEEIGVVEVTDKN